jgi:hypothetical protein
MPILKQLLYDSKIEQNIYSDMTSNTDDIVMWMARALLGNGPVNTPRPNTHKVTIIIMR